MRADRAEFQQNLADYRNRHLEHRGKPLDARLLASFHRLDSAQTMFDNVWGAVEDYVALTVQAHMPEQFALVEIPEEERDPMRPTRFRWALPAGLPPGESEE